MAPSRRRRRPGRGNARVGPNDRGPNRGPRRCVTGRSFAPHLPIPRAKRRHCLGRCLDTRHDHGEKSRTELAGDPSTSRGGAAGAAPVLRGRARHRNQRRNGSCSAQDLAGTPMWFLVVFAAGFVTASAYIVLNFVGRGGQWSQGRFLSFFLVPSVVSAVAFTCSGRRRRVRSSRAHRFSWAR